MSLYSAISQEKQLQDPILASWLIREKQLWFRKYYYIKAINEINSYGSKHAILTATKLAAYVLLQQTLFTLPR